MQFSCNIDSLFLIGRNLSLDHRIFLFSFSSGCIRAPKNLQSTIEDNDVAAERQRIHSDHSNSANDILRMVDLVKVKSLPKGSTIYSLNHTDLWIDPGKNFSCC